MESLCLEKLRRTTFPSQRLKNLLELELLKLLYSFAGHNLLLIFLFFQGLSCSGLMPIRIHVFRSICLRNG